MLAQLEIVLEEKYSSIDFEVVNLSSPHYRSINDLNKLSLNIIGRKPDTVVIVNGYNDVLWSMFQDIYDLQIVGGAMRYYWDQHLNRALINTKTVLPIVRKYFPNSIRLIGALTNYADVKGIRSDIAATKQAYLDRRDSFRAKAEKDSAEAIDFYLNNMDAMFTISKRSGAQVIAAAQPSLYVLELDGKKLTPAEEAFLDNWRGRFAMSDEQVEKLNDVNITKLMPALEGDVHLFDYEIFIDSLRGINSRLLSLCSYRDVKCFDPDPAFAQSEETLFTDHIHWTLEGNNLLAKLIAGEFDLQ